MSHPTKAANSPTTKGFIANFRLITGQPSAEFCCPLCLNQVSSSDISRDEFPPKSIGGTNWVPTCRDCNSSVGSATESHLKMMEGYARIWSETGRHPITYRIGNTTHRALVDMSANPQVVTPRHESSDDPTVELVEQAIIANRMAGRRDDDIGTLSSDVEFAFQTNALEISYLKAAYLAVFNTLGYRGIRSPAYDGIRDRILGRANDIPISVRLSERDPNVESKGIYLNVVCEPDRLQSLLVYMYGFNSHAVRGNEIRLADVSVILPLATDIRLVKYRAAIQAMPRERTLIVPFDMDTRIRSAWYLEFDCGNGRILQLTPTRAFAMASGESKPIETSP